MNTLFETKNKGNKAGKGEWLTPPSIIEALGKFDLDPCAPINRPWNTAAKHYTLKDDGFTKTWGGRVWCNPPYGKQTGKWLSKCAKHNNTIALTFARTETKMFFEHVWGKATAVLFIKGRLKFHHVSGKQGQSAGAPSVLIAYGIENAETLKNCNIEGQFLWVNQTQTESPTTDQLKLNL